MAAKYQVRKLTHAGPGEVARAPPPLLGRRDALQDLSDQAGAVYPIAAAELSLTADELLAQLKAGALASNDLVLEEGAWTSLRDSLAFGEVAAKRARVESARRVLPYVAVLLFPLFALGGVALFIALRELWRR